MRGPRIASIAIRTALALGGAATVGFVAVVLSGLEPLATGGAIVEGAVGSKFALKQTFLQALPVTLTALGVGIAFRAGLFNLGGQGQIYVGALAAVCVVLYVGGLPGVLLAVLALIAAALAGALWGGLAGVLRARLNLSEIITTIMLNFVAFWVVSYLVRGPMKDPDGGGYPYTPEVPGAVSLPILGGLLPLGVLLLLAATLVLWLLLERTAAGLRIKGVGENVAASRFAAVPVTRTVALTMAIAGATGGLAGAVSLLGDQHRLSDFFAANWGFDAVAVALIGRGSPVGTLIAGLGVGALSSGVQSAAATSGVPATVAQIMVGAAVLFVILANADVVAHHLRRLRAREALRERPA